VCLKDGFIPLGIFPNAHKLKNYETLTLLAKFKPGILARREKVEVVPKQLGQILDILDKKYQIQSDVLLRSSSRKTLHGPAHSHPIEFEFIDAPEFVQRKFYKEISDPYDRFYPFHTPNFLMVSKDGEIEIYSHFSKQDKYCAIVGLNVPVHDLSGRLDGLLNQLKELGISYIELLMKLKFTQSIEAALDANFLPSAIYPAMCEDEQGKLQDFVILSRTMEMLDFKGMQVDRSFKPFIDQYVGLWKQMHLETLEIYHESQPTFDT
jgi:hypothetical protein